MSDTGSDTSDESLNDQIARLRSCAYGLIPPRPSWGMGGGSAAEARAQDAWDKEYAAGPDHVRVPRAAVDALLDALVAFDRALPPRALDELVQWARKNAPSVSPPATVGGDHG